MNRMQNWHGGLAETTTKVPIINVFPDEERTSHPRERSRKQNTTTTTTLQKDGESNRDSAGFRARHCLLPNTKLYPPLQVWEVIESDQRIGVLLLQRKEAVGDSSNGEDSGSLNPSIISLVIALLSRCLEGQSKKKKKAKKSKQNKESGSEPKNHGSSLES